MSWNAGVWQSTANENVTGGSNIFENYQTNPATKQNPGLTSQRSKARYFDEYLFGYTYVVVE